MFNLRNLNCRLLFVFCFGATPLLGQTPVFVGGDSQVNTFSTGVQSQPSVAAYGDERFVVVWESYGSAGTDDDQRSIWAQRFNSNGSKVGSEFQVNSYTTGSQRLPSVARTGSGGFVILWSSAGSDGTDSSGTSIQGQRYGSNGQPLGNQFQVNTFTGSTQANTEVSSLASGGFVAVWESNGSSGTDSSFSSIQGQRFDSNGAIVGNEFQVNQYTHQTQFRPHVSPHGEGFVVVWSGGGSSGDDQSSFSVQGLVFDANGSAVGDEFQINQTTTGVQIDPRVSSYGHHRFLVVWQSQGSTGSDDDNMSIQGRRYFGYGTPLGPEFQINDYTTGNQNEAAISTDGAGGALVTWSSAGSPGTDSSFLSVQGQRFRSSGDVEGDQFQVNTVTSNYQFRSALEAYRARDFIVVWESGSKLNADIRSQRLRIPPLFADGFESGDSTAWSAVSP